MEIAQIRHFRRILRQFERVTSSHLRNCCAGVTLAQCLVLLEVDTEDRLAVGQLASRLRLDASTLSRTIDGLERKGMLHRARDDGDRRMVWIRLTRAGKAVCEAIHEQNDAICLAVFDKVPADRQADVVNHFETLVQAFLDSENERVAEPGCRSGESGDRDVGMPGTS